VEHQTILSEDRL